METAVKDYVVARTNDLLQIDYAVAELKAAAKAWLDALGTDGETDATKAYIAALEASIMTVDELAAFEDYADHARALKEKGEKYCDCDACKACADILAKKAQLL